MTDHDQELPHLDPDVLMALADACLADDPGPHVREALMTRARADQALPAGFRVRVDADADWTDHPVPGIRMKVLSLNADRGYATILLDVAPGVRFPAHHHSSAEECYVVSGEVVSYGRRLGPGDFLHADAGTDHGELWTDVGARVLLVVEPEDYMRAVSYPTAGA